MQKLKSYITSLAFFLIPLFFLPITHEFYNINKFTLISATSIILLLISSLQFYKTRKIRWSKKSLALLVPLSAFLATVTLSTIIASTNRVQALLNFSYGPLMLGVLTIFYWYVAQEEDGETFDLLLRLSGFCVAILTAVLFFHPFDAIALPKTFLFLKNYSFSPLGTQVDLILFLGFTFLYLLLRVAKLRRQAHRIDLLTLFGLAMSLFALTITLLNSAPKNNPMTRPNRAPLNLSITSVIKSSSAPFGFLFGSGINNFSTIFTQVKDADYNRSSNWAVSSYDDAFSAIIQILVESGVLSAMAFIWLLVRAFRLNPTKHTAVLLGYVVIMFALTPVSLILFLLLYVCLGLIARDSSPARKTTFHVEENKSLFLIGFINTSTIVTLIILFLFALVPVYRAEVKMRNSVDAIAENDLDKLYSNQYEAVVLNPYTERYRLNFSQTNLFVAKHIASSTKPNQDLITSSVQQAINQAQAAIALNPKKASNWENLGIVYKNVLGVKGAQQWAIAAFQRAVLLDSQNVSYRLELGGVFYSLKQYENAVKTFQEAVLLKPDLPNTLYNLAHAHYQNKNSREAIKIMDSLLALLKKQNSTNYEKVLKERDDFASGTPQNQAPTVIQ